MKYSFDAWYIREMDDLSDQYSAGEISSEQFRAFSDELIRQWEEEVAQYEDCFNSEGPWED